MMLPVLLGRPRPRSGASHAALNAALHRARLAELDRAFEGGGLSAEQHRAEVDEILRRVLIENNEQAPPARSESSRLAALGVVALPLLAIGLYLQLGNPAAVGAFHESAAGIDRLERHLAQSPRDGRAWVMLARTKLERDDFAAAAHAYERALASSAAAARDPQIWCELADALGMAQGRSLDGRPRFLIEYALQLDPAHPRALEMAGSAAIDSLDYAGALGYWERLLAQLKDDSAEHAKLQLALENLRGMQRYIQPPAPPVDAKRHTGVRAFSAPP